MNKLFKIRDLAKDHLSSEMVDVFCKFYYFRFIEHNEYNSLTKKYILKMIESFKNEEHLFKSIDIVSVRILIPIYPNFVWYFYNKDFLNKVSQNNNIFRSKKFNCYLTNIYDVDLFIQSSKKIASPDMKKEFYILKKLSNL